MSNVSKLDGILNLPIEIVEQWNKLDNTEKTEVYLKVHNTTKEQIQALIKEAVPEMKETDNYGNYILGLREGYNQAIEDFKANLIKQGLIETNKERK